MSGSSSLSPGQLLAGRYEVLATLGQGGMGVVYKAHDRVLNETVAIKVLRQDMAGSPEMAQRFLAEIKMARSVSHRNVCRIHEYGQDGDLRYISMAFVDGVDLKQVLRERGPLPPAQAFDLAIGVAEGLQAIHDEGIIHRDLKAPNLMLDARGVVRLMDFGIAKQWTDSASASLTGTGMIVGTPEYMSPEQVLGKKLDLRSDLYALGVVVYEFFAGVTPFRAETPVGLLMKHLHDPPALDAAGLPPALVPVLARALAKDREDRYASAAEMAEALRVARQATTGASGARTAPGPRPPVPERTTLVPRPVAPAATVALVPGPAAPAATTAVSPPAPSGPSAPPAAVPAAARRRRSWILPVAGATALMAILVVAAAVVALRGRETPSPSLASTATTLPAAAAATPPPPAPAATSTPAPAAMASVAPPSMPPPRAATPAPRREGAAARSAAAQEVEGLLAEAETAFAAQQHKTALAFYEEALRLDPGNQRARIGRELCTNALAQAAVAAAQPQRAFTSGRTQFSGNLPAAAGPAGFESSTGVAARRVDQPAAAPGKLVFEVEPPAVRAGDAFVVKVYMANEGSTVLRLADATVASTTDGRTASGPVALLAREAPPRRRTLILSTGGQWRAEVTSWTLAVTVRTAAGETYRNELAWK